MDNLLPFEEGSILGIFHRKAWTNGYGLMNLGPFLYLLVEYEEFINNLIIKSVFSDHFFNLGVNWGVLGIDLWLFNYVSVIQGCWKYPSFYKGKHVFTNVYWVSVHPWLRQCLTKYSYCHTGSDWCLLELVSCLVNTICKQRIF